MMSSFVLLQIVVVTTYFPNLERDISRILPPSLRLIAGVGAIVYSDVMFPALGHFTDVALLLLRIMVGLVFVASGWEHVSNPSKRSKDIEMSKGFTVFLGVAELAGGLGVMFGVLAQLAAIGLILIMLGAIQKKIFVWRTGFWGASGTNGWSYDTMVIVMNLVVLTAGGGDLSLSNWLP